MLVLAMAVASVDALHVSNQDFKFRMFIFKKCLILRTQTQTRTHTHVCTRTHIYTQTCTHADQLLSTCVVKSAYTYMRIYHYTHARIYAYTYIRACIFADLHTSMHAWWACRAGNRDSGLSLNESVTQLNAFDTLIHACDDRNTLIKKENAL
jgi:hypothetical protein